MHSPFIVNRVPPALPNLQPHMWSRLFGGSPSPARPSAPPEPRAAPPAPLQSIDSSLDVDLEHSGSSAPGTWNWVPAPLRLVVGYPTTATAGSGSRPCSLWPPTVWLWVPTTRSDCGEVALFGGGCWSWVGTGSCSGVRLAWIHAPFPGLCARGGCDWDDHKKALPAPGPFAALFAWPHCRRDRGPCS